MLKHLLALLTLSIIAILFIQQFATALHYLGSLHSWVADKLSIVFVGMSAGHLISHVLALVIIPPLIALIPAFLFWLVKRSELPHLFLVTWIIWIILVSVVAMR